MKKTIAFISALFVTSPAHAFLGFGDITFDPTTYGEVSALYKQTMEIYDNAKKQLDRLADIERTIKEAQEAQAILASTDLKQVSAGLKPNRENTKTAAGLRAELLTIEGNAGSNKSYVQYQLARIKQLENLELLQKASAANTEQSTGEMNSATSGRITAQSVSTLAALGAAEEQRRVKEEYERAAGARATVDSLNSSKKLYRAMAK